MTSNVIGRNNVKYPSAWQAYDFCACHNWREYFIKRQSVFKYRLEIKEAKRIWVNDYKVGEILNTCWGYDQTNREFYKIKQSKEKRLL
jgi:hypothetical protein